MKKLLLGSMLVLGATSFGAVLEDLQTNGEKPAVLNIRVKGTVVDDTKYSLIVKPLDGTNTTDTMQFNFDGLLAGKEQIVEGAYSAGVYQSGNLIDDAYRIEASLKRNGQDVNNQKYTNMSEVDLTYSSETPQAVGKEYRGKVNVKAVGKAKGAFLDNGVNLEVLVRN